MKHRYHNTTQSSGDELAEYQQQAMTQEEKILVWFKSDGGKIASPSEVQLFCGLKFSPLTSVRRAISNLTRDGKLVKTDNQVEGNYGRPEYLWRLADG